MAHEMEVGFQYQVGDLLQRFFQNLSEQELVNVRHGLDAGFNPTLRDIAFFWEQKDAPSQIHRLQTLKNETNLRSTLIHTAVDNMSLIERRLYDDKLGLRMEKFDKVTAQAELLKLRQFADDLVARTQPNPGESGAPLK